MFPLCGREDRPYLNYEDRRLAGRNDGIHVARQRCFGESLEKSVCENYSLLVVIESIRKFNHAVPFVPYEIRTVSGETYQIPHPDFILVPPKGSYVVVIDSKDPREAPNHISALLIERATPLDSQQRRKPRKRS
jgi:hypothetical protein